MTGAALAAADFCDVDLGRLTGVHMLKLVQRAQGRAARSCPCPPRRDVAQAGRQGCLPAEPHHRQGRSMLQGRHPCRRARRGPRH
eukprot:4281415-Alexandrium_andersonii.AAC.1